jgi:CheY-like chemotaxis protein
VTILLVEDEALIRAMLVMEFEDAGFEVLEAGSADEAVALLAGGREAAVVVTDVRMPGRLDGLGLAAWLAEHRAGLPVVVTSGYAQASDAHRTNPAVAAVLAKPYLPAEVVALVVGLILERAA